MIALLRGRLHEKHPGTVILEVNGVGYQVQVPLSTYYDLGEAGTEVALRVHTHVREDQLALYGFASALEQRIFERLIAVSGVGPRMAIGILSGIAPDELVRAVSAGDLGRLTRIPGIGKKTAERISLELKDRFAELVPGAGAGDARAGLKADLVSALLNLGYQRGAAEQAIERALAAGGEPAFEPTLRLALGELAK